MTEARAIKRLLKGLENIKTQVLKFKDDTRISEIKTYQSLLADEWKEFQALEKLQKGKFDDAHLDSIDTIEALHLELKQKLVKFEKLYDENNAHHTNYTLDELVFNQSNFLQQMSTLNKRENEVRLPRVNIPVFSGNYSEFPSFRDLFEASIHKNNNISKVHKLQYLKGLLKGEAYALITHLTITEANYDEAWDKIKARYDKRKHVVHTLLKKFIEQPNLQQSCSKALRRLSDVSDEVIRGLKVLGEQAESRDRWLIYLLVNKLDYDSKEAWAHETAEIDFPTLDQFFGFLNKRSDALESLSSIQKAKPNSIKRVNSLMTQPNIIVCPLCSGEHYLGKCEKYLSLTIPERKQVVVEKKLCFNCLASTHQSTVCRSKFNCRICRRKHHLTLHIRSTTDGSEEVKAEDNSNTESTSFNALLKPESPQSKLSQAILPTASVLIKDKFGKSQRCRILLDSGSQTSFITESCVQRLRLQRNKANVSISGITSGSVTSKGKVVITLQSVYDSGIQMQVSALILNNLPSRLPSYNIKSDDKRWFQNLQLADPDYDKPAPIDVLIGADKFFAILEGAQQQFKSTILHKTIFGWIVSGQQAIKQGDNSATFLALNLNLVMNMDVDNTLRKFWEIEELPQIKKFSPEEVKCEEFFTQTHKRQQDGRYIVKLPFKNSSLELGNSLISATRRFFALERKLANNPKLKELYIQQMREYLELGHMTEVLQAQDKLGDKSMFYLPHHSVMKEDSLTTKMRIVFDGSSKTSTGTSLNDMLMVGPTIQPTLWATLMRFRGNRIALTADIEKMYRQVLIASDDSNYQRILWRENSDQQIRHYKLTRVTFGLASSAYLAIRVLQQLACDSADDIIKQHIINDFYVDDLLTGSRDVQSAIRLKQKIISILQSGGFSLRKWKSNISCLCDEMNDSSTTELCSDGTSTVKILGLHWHPADDSLTFKVNLERDGPITKRKIISESSRVFDPLGFLSPSIILLKILFQKLWFLKIDWNDQLPKYFEDEYKRVRNEFSYFEDIKMQRFTNHYQNISFHGFADASEVAYSAVVYSLATDEKGETIVNFLTSKTKVAPVKKVSLPRLELCAAHLLSKLMFTVKETIEPTAKCYAWTDSSIVLAWLSTYPAKWKTFVANRTSQILDKFPRQHWGHVKSSDNPADHGSRGVYPKQLLNLDQWWHGPEWLRKPESFWPTTQVDEECNQTAIDTEANKRHLVACAFQAVSEVTWLDEIFNRSSKLKKIFRIVAYVKRFITNSRISATTKKNFGELKASEIEEAKIICIKWVQRGHFHDDIKNLRRDQRVNNESKLLSLAPFLDGTDIIRVGGRLFNADCEYNSKHPIILPSNHVFTEKLIWETHLKNLHAGPTLTNNLLRENYWIINGRTKIRLALRKCVICVKYAHKTSTQLMGNLPAERVTPTKPFTNCGIDFAGPLYFASKKGRGGTNPVKGYLCIFVCLSVKAVHIEAVSDMTTEAFLAALKRFAARRGVPKKIYTDNGSNFIGAKRILNEAYKLITNINNNYVVSEYLSDNGIDWHFIPPASPHFGGLWESAVKSVKTHLLKSTSNVNLTFEEMTTLLCQIENILNSRPLTAASSDDNYEVLTPSHFLLGSSTGSVPEKEIEATDTSLTRWQRIQRRVQIFWKKYYRDYLNNLQQRRKWQNTTEDIKTDDIVIIKEDNIPVSKWPLGRVIQTHPGNDGLVRVVTIKTSSSTLQRPVVKICKLPVS